ncbi:hypothetical protein [Palleronia sp. LCG004]|uniref:hypothetical protein n=1 Tax=Palleronia sp. LCG004 TaxID=3079304 RepID=UPI002943411B|nr:hypothetical protein [Palleronia sp. LCG004]WOI56069.1 hypothetical protein RVY76_13660 [Palleronia sp. LCG004]
MSFLRPGALETILRWREAAIGAAAAALGLYWAWSDPGIMRWVGVAFVLGGVAIAREGLSRARRPGDGGGPGVVEVTERQIAYFSAEGGGAVAVDDLIRVHVDTTIDGPYQSDIFWVLTPESGQALHIPGDAEGAAKIFDALAPLEGVDYAAAIRATSKTEAGRFLVWERSGTGNPRLSH